MGDLETAQHAYEGALDLEPRFAQVRLDLGKLHEVRNDLVAAERSYRAALETLPTLSEAAIALAQVYRRAGRSRLAVNLLIEVLQNDPSDLETLIGLGQSLLDDGRVERALEAFRRVLAYQSNHAGAQFYLAVALGRQRCYTEAIARWQSVIALEPNGPFAHEARKHIRTANDLQHVFPTKVA